MFHSSVTEEDEASEEDDDEDNEDDEDDVDEETREPGKVCCELNLLDATCQEFKMLIKARC